ncbi:hypothetical protein QKV95_gp012 [Poseidoniales virus YSH_150918]|uniref:Uncharacterized protein n=1 Tax=Poseidoniales virus YSH_150918 TaxID=3071324 RepID=A0A976YF68_9CAUD|nr:hypothetical protein QKV95_gp012 [Yangshan Harbor Poseidoniales virus]UVF62486.1 hypothetical protein [Poseidoniales virus YSH_150918]
MKKITITLEITTENEDWIYDWVDECQMSLPEGEYIHIMNQLIEQEEA